MKRFSSFITVFFSVCLCCGLIGCTPFGGFKPQPPEWTYWRKLEADVKALDIQKAMMECGYVGLLDKHPSVPWRDSATGELLSLEGIDPDVNYLAYRCMKQDEFVYQREFGRPGTWCDSPRWSVEKLACHPETAVPIRSVKRRLNSVECRHFSNKEVCKP